MNIQHVGVIGAGTMGNGIAQVCAMAGLQVTLVDVSDTALQRGLATITASLDRLVQKEKLQPPEKQAVLGRIRGTVRYQDLGHVTLVIEAATENPELKLHILREIEAVLAPGAVIASNTSSISISQLAAVLKRPDRCIGMHFFNPVPLMPLVEVVRGSWTSDAALATAVAYALAMGKTPVVVKDCPGFLVNRVLTTYMRGFLQLVADGADFAEVDRVMESFGWPMGPAYLEDVVGMDTGSHVNDVISSGYPERMPPLQHDALALMARAGRYGQKSGLGFYRYDPGAGGKPTRSTAGDTHALLTAVQPNGQRQFAEAEILDRMMLPMIVEAAHALDEGVVGTPAELDLALQLGLGFPAHAGGPLKYADWLGLAEVVRRCERLRQLGPQFEPTPRMRTLAAENGCFHLS